jgi:hypothetical protein
VKRLAVETTGEKTMLAETDPGAIEIEVAVLLVTGDDRE